MNPFFARSQREITSQAYNREALRHLDNHDLDQARQTLHTALRAYPTNCILYYNLACTESLAHDMEAAYEAMKSCFIFGYRDFERVLEDPDLRNLRELHSFWDLLKEFGFASPPRPARDTTLPSDIDEPQLFFTLACTECSAGNNEVAWDYLRTALRLARQNGCLPIMLTRLQANGDLQPLRSDTRYARFVKDFELGCCAPPTSPVSTTSPPDSNPTTLEDAEELRNEVEEPLDANTINQEAVAHIDKRNLDQARSLLHRALRAYPTDAILYYNLACTESIAEDLEAAYECMKSSFIFGYKDFEHVLVDHDLENLREQPAFWALLLQFGYQSPSKTQSSDSRPPTPPVCQAEYASAPAPFPEPATHTDQAATRPAALRVKGGKAIDESSQTTPHLFDNLTMDTGSNPDATHLIDADSMTMVRIAPRYTDAACATVFEAVEGGTNTERNLEDEVVSVVSSDDECISEVEEYEDWDMVQPTVAQPKPHPPVVVGGVAPPAMPAHEPTTPFSFLPKMCILSAMGLERTTAKDLLKKNNGDIDRALECLLVY